MTQLTPLPSEPAAAVTAWRAWPCRAGLAVLPLVLALTYYYQPVLWGGLDLLPDNCDAGFYVYQLARSADVGGRWWQLGTDELVGYPYQTVAAKNPALYEGVELLLVSAVTARLLPPVLNYHAMILLVLLVNGWVAAWLVRRLTGSYFWAAVAVVLITLNASTGLRLNGHLHLFKYAWVLLVVWRFVRYLDAPTARRGVLLGLAAALLLQGSFYLAFLLALVLTVWWLGCLLAGRLGRAHVVPTCVGLLTAGAVGAALTFPVWALSRDVALIEHYFRRDRREVWIYGADLWQYVVSPRLDIGAVLADARVMPPHEGWHYAGLTVLLAVGLYIVLRLRGQRVAAAHARFVNTAMGLIALCVLLSLSGGPSALLHSVVQSFRSYGRAGLIAVALWSVAAPVVLHGGIGLFRRRAVRGALGTSVLALALFDGTVVWGGPVAFSLGQSLPRPAWVEWLAQQPADVRLAVLPDYTAAHNYPTRPWDALQHRTFHRHRILNGAETALLKADLGLLGAGLDCMNAASLRYVLALGYNRLAFQQAWLVKNPWIGQVPWLEQVEVVADWHIFRANERLPALPALPLRELLARQVNGTPPTVVPAETWITERFDLEQPVAVSDNTRVTLAWADAERRLVTRPAPALLHHVYTPAHPAYCVCTPATPGRYTLVFLDEQQRWLAAKPYEVTGELRTSQQARGDRVPTVCGTTLAAPDGHGRWRVTVANETPHYIQAHVTRGRWMKSSRLVPTLVDPAGGSLMLWVRVVRVQDEQPIHEQVLVLPCDVPPHARREVELPAHCVPTAGGPYRVEVRPHFHEQPANVAAAGNADIRLEATAAVAQSR